MGFLEDKRKQLVREDLSDEGKWDLRICDLCEKINSLENYYTTSSCSGRIYLKKGGSEKIEDSFLWKTHDEVRFEDFLREVRNSIEFRSVRFKMEGPILHVCCRDINWAKRLLDLGIKCGWKKSGILSLGERIVVEMVSTENLEMPLVLDGELLVDEKFLKVIFEEAVLKMNLGWEKIERLKKRIG